MKKSLLLPAVAACFLSASAAVETPAFYTENFRAQSEKGDFPTDGWTTRGIESTPIADITAAFPGLGTESKYVLIDYGMQTLAMSPTNYTDDAVADEWLISPAIEVTPDNVELSFTAATYTFGGKWGAGNNTFKVMVSSTGTAPEDFTEVFDDYVNSVSAQEVVLKDYCVALSGYAGKKIHIAFVNTGQNVGLTGFSNVVLGDYAVTFDNFTAEISTPGTTEWLSVNVGIKTPVKCPGVNATLTYGNTKIEKYFKKAIGNTGNKVIYIRMDFEDTPFDFTESSVIDYTLTVVPAYEGAPASTLTGNITQTNLTYPSNVVMEELTSVQCQYCPYGISALEYFTDTYPIEEGKPKFIPIGIHALTLGEDPMAEDVALYVSNTMDLNGTTSLPQCILNRSTQGLSPNNRDWVTRIFSQPSQRKAEIKEVKVAGDGQALDVTFDTYNAYTSKSVDLNACVVITEDKVKGNSLSYNQLNAIYNMTEAQVSSSYGEFLLPYLKKYMIGGEYGMNPVPYSLMEYEHVARGIFPSYDGTPIQREWVEDVPQSNTFTVEMPESVMDIRNLNVIVLILNPATQAIVASDIMSANKFEMSGVEEVADGGFDARLEGSNLVVAAADGARVEVLNAQGMPVAGARVAGGSATIDMSGNHGIIIVRVADSSNSSVRKFIL